MYKIVFENEHFVICDKSPMVLSVPGRQGEDDQRPVLGKLLEKDLGITIYPVHRLDFEVQGLIMYAKNPSAHKIGNFWFENKEVSKTYCAHTTSIENNQAQFKIGEDLTWQCMLLRGKKRAYESAHGKKSITTAKLIKVDKNVFIWHLNPVTGRGHQLRYELYRHGHPIVGDELYGSKEVFKGQGIALRAFKIDFKDARDATKFGLPEIIEISDI